MVRVPAILTLHVEIRGAKIQGKKLSASRVRVKGVPLTESATALHKGLMIKTKATQGLFQVLFFCTFVRYYVSILIFPSAFLLLL